MKLDFIKTIDFTYRNIEVINCRNINQFKRKVKNNEVISVLNQGYVEHINSSYIMFFAE